MIHDLNTGLLQVQYSDVSGIQIHTVLGNDNFHDSMAKKCHAYYQPGLWCFHFELK